MKIKKQLLMLIVCMLVLALVAGCGSGGSSTGGGTAADGSGGTAADGSGGTATDGNDVVIRAVHPGNSEAFFDIYAEIIKNFEAENPGIKVEFESFPEGYDEKLLTLFSAGDAPDVIRTHAQDLGSRVKRGMLAPVTTYFNSEGFGDDLMEVAVASYEGDLYYVDPYFAVLVLYYNKDIFDAAGVAYPTDSWTWQDLKDASEKLTVRDGENITQYGYLGDWHNRFWMTYYWSQGQNLFDDETSPTRITFDNQTALDGIQLVSDTTYPVVGIASEAGGSVSATEYFTNGMVGMQIDGSWMANVFAAADDLNFGVALLPMGAADHGGMSVSCGEAMSSQTKHPDEAWKYIKATFNKESSLLLSGFGDPAKSNGVPVWFSAYNDPRWKPNENIEMIGKQAQVTTRAQPPFQYSAKWMWDIMLPTFQEMITENLDTRTTLDLLISRTQRDILDEMD